MRLLLIALGLLIAQGPMLFHLLLVPHATCEHGELVDAPLAGRVAAESHSRAPEAARANGSAAVSEGSTAPSSHEHCDALAVRHRVPEVGPSIGAASLLSIESLTEGDARAEMRAVPLLSLAPKGSPPQA